MGLGSGHLNEQTGTGRDLRSHIGALKVQIKDLKVQLSTKDCWGDQESTGAKPKGERRDFRRSRTAVAVL